MASTFCHKPDPELRKSGMPDGVLIPAPVKATRFPGQELRWDKSRLEFTNHPEATKTIVKRDYRDGFAPPAVT